MTTDAVVWSATSTAPARLVPKRISIDCGERTQPSRTIQSNSTLRTPSRAAACSGPSGVSAATRPPGPPAADLVDLAGVVQRPVRVRAQVDQQAAVDEPPHHERPHVSLLADQVRGAERVGDPVGRRAARDRR
ncbi:hypothetical protein QWM81_05070 [Streptomyces ficellus]|uniref:Uncharacterized protein n=1 Tax=Streptomyces ficellus TaxID=1977088 RepID=A0ABT7Z1P9_9ACTN|nr:hypothetical protein [Streptomyces ficellus]MDN3293419.1 hypothetical protein [Streptomyces ficellus]